MINEYELQNVSVFECALITCILYGDFVNVFKLDWRGGYEFPAKLKLLNFKVLKYLININTICTIEFLFKNAKIWYLNYQNAPIFHKNIVN